ncbi:MAG: extracellular solute-binding protein, partial [Fibrobacter sp.]|nr:extracellular solute-binding protein [Fibrobacter sp.]
MPKYMLKRFFYIVIVALLSACGNQTDNKQVVLDLWVMPNSPEPQRDTEKLVRGFELENPGIKVNVTVVDWGNAWARITTAATTQNGPDVIQMPTSWTAAITEMGSLLALDSLLHTIGGAQKFPPAMMQYSQPRGSDSITSLPWFVDVRPMFYRKDVLAKVGINPRKIITWHDFKRALEKIRVAKPVIEGISVLPMGYPGKNDWNVIHNFAPWIYGMGGDFLNEAGTKSMLSSPETMEAIIFYLDFVRLGYNEARNLEKNTAQVSSEFDDGRLAFWFDATTKTIYMDRPQYAGNTAKSPAARNYGCMLPPTSPTGKNRYFIGGSGLSVFKYTQHSKEAIKLLEYLVARPEVQLQMARTSAFLPALKATWSHPYFKDNSNYQVFLRMAETAKAYPS